MQARQRTGLEDRRVPAIVSLLTWAMCRGVSRHFSAVRFSGSLPVVPEGQGIVVFSNHSSWWDPAVFALLQKHLFPGRAACGPIDAEALARYPLLERGGFIPVTAGDFTSIRRFLRIASARLDQGDVVWITAEGVFSDPATRPVNLKAGVAHLSTASRHAVMVPLGIDYAFWQESRPEVLLRFGDPVQFRPDDTMQDRQAACRNALERTLDRLLKDRQARDPSRFQILRAGRSGIGGVYDGMRRLRAWSAWRRFDNRHERPPGAA